MSMVEKLKIRLLKIHAVNVAKFPSSLNHIDYILLILLYLW